MITVYTKNNCMQCEFTKRTLDDLGVTYQTINVEENQEALNDLLNADLRAMPVVSRDGTLDNVFTGFRPDMLKELADEHDK